MSDPVSKYNLNIVRDCFLLGDPAHTGLLRRLFKGFYFLNPREGLELDGLRVETFFVVAAIDLTDLVKCQVIARVFANLKSPLVERLVFVVAPDVPTREQLLFLQEIGARYAAYGDGRNDDIKENVKRLVIDATQTSLLDPMKVDLEAAIKAGDPLAIKKVIAKLSQLPQQGEDVLRLTAIASTTVADNKKCESCLKKILAINPQNLWAANQLGKLYLRSGAVAQGVEILERLSRYHELNGERLLALGNAYAEAGLPREAEAKFKAGSQLGGNADERFKEGLAKVKLLERDGAGALALLGKTVFSRELMSFLNLRAIMAIRAGSFDEGISYYENALQGAGESKELQAKLKFNLGLAYARSADLAKAQQAFLESVALGGSRFARAKGPLEIVKTVLKNRTTKGPSYTPKVNLLENEEEWETLY